MPKREKTKRGAICEGCLSRGRTLLPINEHLRVYEKLMEDFITEALSYKTAKTKVPVMCWECRSILRNIQKFEKRARQAFELLTLKQKLNKNENIHPQLSTLMTITKTSIDFDISHDYEQEFETEVKIKIERDTTVSDVKYENKLDLKPDSIDSDEIIAEFIKPESGISADEATEDVFEDNCNAIVTLKQDTDAEGNAAELIEEINEKLRMQLIIEKRKLSAQSKYRLIKFNECGSKSYKRIVISEEERARWFEEQRIKESYLAANYKCEPCAAPFSRKDQYIRHLNKFHAESNPYACDTCNVRFTDKTKLTKHVKSHSFKYICTVCGHESRCKSQHDRHCNGAHRRAVECTECGVRFQKWQEFYKHYDSNHKRFVCDYCGFRATSKPRLVNHIKVRHGDNECPHCNKRYTLHHTLRRHIALRHARAPAERAYCVECDAQFDNEALYVRHLKTSVKHRPRVGHPCPECGKVYAKNIAMQNHYKYIHLQQTKYYCEECSRYFLNGFRLRTHIASFHNKIQPPKNKICSYCGRGFRTNRILVNHTRTHTGERPFSCGYCTATFAQKTALVVHTRSIHKVTVTYSNVLSKE